MEQKQRVVLVQEGAHWAQIQLLAQNAVVQVFAQIGRYNWIEPYNVVDQHENRGSGFFINDQGYLVTNMHVVDEAKHVWVQIPALGRMPIGVEIVGVCPDRDLALLRLKKNELQQVHAILGGLPFLTFGNSDELTRTDGVLALGYPLGQHRLKSSTGVVSGFESIAGRTLIQSTVPVNPGSSGGPLINVRGQVVGIVVASAVPAENVGFAIPSNELTMVLDALYTDQLVRKPLLGVRFSYANDEQAQYLGNPLPAGLYVSRVYKNLLFDRATIQTGDMLYEFNGYRIDAYGDAVVPWSTDKTSLHDLLARIQTGEEVQAVVYRRAKRLEVTFRFEVGVLNPIRIMFPDYELVEYEVVGGLVMMQLVDNHLPLLAVDAPDLFKYAKFEHKSEPILVITHVLPGSYAHQLRVLQAGDIVTQVNDQPVATLADLREALKKSLANNFLAITTDQDVFAVFSFDRLLADEGRLSRTFTYPISPGIRALKEAVTAGGVGSDQE